MNLNSIIVGVLIGLIVPFVGYALFLELNDYLTAHPIAFSSGSQFDGFSQRLSALLAICLNLLPFNYFKRERYDEGLRGVVFPTVLYVVMWMVNFGLKLF